VRLLARSNHITCTLEGALKEHLRSIKGALEEH
jgi:hypothetical protein